MLAEDEWIFLRKNRRSGDTFRRNFKNLANQIHSTAAELIINLIGNDPERKILQGSLDCLPRNNNTVADSFISLGRGINSLSLSLERAKRSGEEEEKSRVPQSAIPFASAGAISNRFASRRATDATLPLAFQTVFVSFRLDRRSFIEAETGNIRR